jgi:hypothetical protein
VNKEALKIELINWITELKDFEALDKLLLLKKKLSHVPPKKESQIFGSGSHLISFIAEDFNEPLDIFNDYQK